MSGVVLAFSRAFFASVGACVGYVGGGAGRLVGPGAPLGFAGPLTFADIVQRVNPAVVHVDVIETTRQNPHEGVEAAPDLEIPGRGEGPGFIRSPSRHILTNPPIVPG